MHASNESLSTVRAGTSKVAPSLPVDGNIDSPADGGPRPASVTNLVSLADRDPLRL